MYLNVYDVLENIYNGNYYLNDVKDIFKIIIDIDFKTVKNILQEQLFLNEFDEYDVDSVVSPSYIYEKVNLLNPEDKINLLNKIDSEYESDIVELIVNALDSKSVQLENYKDTVINFLFIDLFRSCYMKEIKKDQIYILIRDILRNDNVNLFKAHLQEGTFNMSYIDYYGKDLVYLAVDYNAISIFLFLYDMNELNVNDSIMSYIIKCGNYELFKLLINKGYVMYFDRVNIVTRNILTSTPEFIDKFFQEFDGDISSLIDISYLINEVRFNRVDGIKHCIENGFIDINKPYINGINCFIFFIKYSSIDFFEFMLNKGADIYSEVKGKYHPLYSALYNNDKFIFKQLVELYDRKYLLTLDLLFSAGCDANNTFAVKYLIENKLYIEDRFNRYPSLLSNSLMKNNYELFEILLDLGINPNGMITNKFNLLQYASCEKGDIKYVKLLVEHGADVNKHKGTTPMPLVEAARANKLDVVKYLVANGANVKPKHLLFTQIPIAPISKKKNPEVYEYLVSLGAKKSVFYIAIAVIIISAIILWIILFFGLMNLLGWM